MLEAVIFDVDGTIADTECDGHRPAFNAAFAAHGLDIVWSPEEYGRLLAVTGGQRRIAQYLAVRGYGDGALRLSDEIHRTKTELFRERILDGAVCARPGLPELVDDLRTAGIRIAVATTGRRAWVDPLLAALLGTDAVEVTVTGDDVTRLKPDAEVYQRALRELGVAAPNALAVEDSAVGLQAALAAGVATVVVRTEYTAGQDFTGAAAVRDGFSVGPRDEQSLRASGCRQAHARWWRERSQK
ncbi:MAG: HAD-IA family hydrolase [Mycobacterium sp.]